MAQAAAAVRAGRAPSKAKPKARSKAQRAPRSRIAGGTLWITVVALSLAGVVALNVAVLRLNVQLEEFGTERSRLRAERADLASQIATRATAGRIHSLARGQLGLVPAEADQWTYLDLGRSGP